MRTIHITLLLIVFCTTAAMAQKMDFGLRLGLNVANQYVHISNSPPTLLNARIGLLAGGYMTTMFSEKVGIQSEILYSQVGSKSTLTFPPSGPTVQSDIFLSYLTVPVMFRISPIKRIHLLVGPQYGLLLSAKWTLGSTSNSSTNGYNSSEFSVVGGLGWDVGPFNLGARYVYGISPLGKNDNFITKNRTLQFVIGYRLFGR